MFIIFLFIVSGRHISIKKDKKPAGTVRPHTSTAQWPSSLRIVLSSFYCVVAQMVLIMPANYTRIGPMDEKKDMMVERVSSPRETILDLKAVRETRGLSLRAIFETTRVGLVNLAAVENGDFNRLPPPVYARDFIRKYAQAIGIDEKPILDRYEKYLESLKPPQEGTEVRKPWPEANRRYRFLFMSLAAVILAGILVSALFLYDQAGKPLSPAPAAVEAPPAKILPAPDVEPPPGKDTPAATNTAVLPDAPAQRTVSVPAPAPTPAPAEKIILPPAATGKMYNLIIEARELTWIRITEDRNPSYQALLKPGDRIERMASDFFQLDIGNAGGINLTFQGKPLGSLGKQGQIIHMRLPEKGSERKSP
jgi:cytoskeleton protein RodZ